MEKYQTELDLQLQKIACGNWAQFVQLVGESHITSAKICILRNGGKSYGQIATKLYANRNSVISTSRKCPCDE